MAYQNIDYAPCFKKLLKKAPKEIQKALVDRIDLFTNNPYHPLLRNHALKGIYQGHRSINITGDWRALYEEYEDRTIAYFTSLGTHSQLYK